MPVAMLLETLMTALPFLRTAMWSHGWWWATWGDGGHTLCLYSTVLISGRHWLKTSSSHCRCKTSKVSKAIEFMDVVQCYSPRRWACAVDMIIDLPDLWGLDLKHYAIRIMWGNVVASSVVLARNAGGYLDAVWISSLYVLPLSKDYSVFERIRADRWTGFQAEWWMVETFNDGG